MQQDNKMNIVAKLASAYFSNHSVAIEDIPAILNMFSEAVDTMRNPTAPVVRKEPAVSIKQSITPDYLVSLEDGQKYKSLKRHLRTQYNMTPDEYRAKWGLPADYPMVAPNYAARRSELAKGIGLGRKSEVTEA